MDPHLYSARDGSTTGFHQDLAATGGESRADAALVLEEWGRSLNFTGSVIHSIRQKDAKSAESDLQQSLLSEQNLKNLVVRLDMIDTDAATFQIDNHANVRSLRDLLNQSREFDKLRGAETTFRDQKNVSGMMSVLLQGEAIRTKVRSNYHEFAGRSDRVISISRKFGLDTAAFEQSVKDFAAILAEIEAAQDARSSSISETIQDYKTASAISLKVLPDHGAYGDTLSMAGTVSAPAGAKVTVSVDGLQAGDVTVDGTGRFTFPYRIEQVEAGAHTAYASVGSDISDVSNFTVEGGNSTISLSVRLADGNGTRKGIGAGRLLTEGGVPIRGARVSVMVDGRTPAGYGITGDDGVYALTAESLPSGSHTLIARFDPLGFPLNGSESAPVTVEGQSLVGWIASLVYLLAVGGAAVGGVLFLRGRHATDDAPPSADAETAEPARLVEPLPMARIEEARMIADQVTVTSDGRVDGYETISRTYHRLVRELEAKTPDLRLQSQTPRRLAVLFADHPFGDQLRMLVEIHEKVRYAEREPTEEDLRQAREAFIYIITEGGGH